MQMQRVERRNLMGATFCDEGGEPKCTSIPQIHQRRTEELHGVRVQGRGMFVLK